MNGRLGALFQNDEQIGGLLDWTLNFNLKDAPSDWEILSEGYWLFIIPSGLMAVKLYPTGEFYWECLGKIVSIVRPSLDKLIHESITIAGSSPIEGKK
jgi:hypothetical protein